MPKRSMPKSLLWATNFKHYVGGTRIPLAGMIDQSLFGASGFRYFRSFLQL